MDDWSLQVISTLGYLGLALLLVAENLFPPIPSEVVLPLAGFVVGRGDLGFLQALAASTTGSVAGALILYTLGRYGGRGLVLRYGSWLRVSVEELERAEGWFRRYGDWVVLGARVVPLARSIVSIPAGIMKMPLLRFTLLTALGASGTPCSSGQALSSAPTGRSSRVGSARTPMSYSSSSPEPPPSSWSCAIVGARLEALLRPALPGARGSGLLLRFGAASLGSRREETS